MSVMSQCYSVIIEHGISAPVNGKEVVDGLNAIDKRYIYQLMSTVQLPGSKIFLKQIIMHSCTQNNDVSLAKEFQKHQYSDNSRHGVIGQGKDRKRDSKRKWTDRDYHVQDNANVAQKDVKMYCDTNQLPEFPFCGSHPKPRRSSVLSKHYHILFDPNLGHGICEICRIPCACVACTSMIDQPWISGVHSTK